mmetsp:Transcript_19022/g.43031  ORF Transcript_19022/g.43031 Transcript_19022/m.43031 type:complete len:218 (+) Transcript_19022:1508-2161(+)
MTRSSASAGSRGAMCFRNRSAPPICAILAIFSTAEARTSASLSWRRPAKSLNTSDCFGDDLGLEPKPREPATVEKTLARLCLTRQDKSSHPPLTTGRTTSAVSPGSLAKPHPTLPAQLTAKSLTESCSSLLSAWNIGTSSYVTSLLFSSAKVCCGLPLLINSSAVSVSPATLSTNLPRCRAALRRTMGVSSSLKSLKSDLSSRLASSAPLALLPCAW